jgi:S1-C subfamily serine protease
MKRFLVLLALAGLLSYGIYRAMPHPRSKAPAVRYPPTPGMRDAILSTKKITVLVEVDSWSGVGRGTGVLIDSTHVLTCAHVVDEQYDQMFIDFYPGYLRAHGKAVYIDKDNDLAVVEMDVPVNADRYAVFTASHYDGEPIIIVGNSLGSVNWFVTYGIVSGENSRDLYTDGQIFPGNSGGPWVDDKGRIVALSAWGLEDNGKGVGINGGIASHTIYDFLRAYQQDQIKQGEKKHDRIK